MDGVTLVVLLALLLISWLVVYGVRLWAQRRQILDVPNQRSSHSRPTPRGGGVAIVVGTVVTGLWYLAFEQFQPTVLAYVVGGVLIAAISWLDDVRSVSNRVRFGCHLVGAVLVLVALALSRDAPHAALGLFGLPPWLVGLGLALWIVGLTNIYNFMDGIDGLAGSQAVVTALWWLFIGTQQGAPAIATLALAVVASGIGFLLHNWPPARIFMGDVGSAFLGYTFAVLPLLALQATGQAAALVGGVLAIWPFLFDGGLTIIRRALAGENIFQAHRSHLYQRLTICGWSHRAVSLLYIGYAVVSATCAYALVIGNWPWSIASIPIICGALLFLLVGRIEQRSAALGT